MYYIHLVTNQRSLTLPFSCIFQEWLQKSDDPKLYDFRKKCRERARQLEQLVMFEEGASLETSEDLLVKAEESNLDVDLLENLGGGKIGQRDKQETKS